MTRQRKTVQVGPGTYLRELLEQYAQARRTYFLSEDPDGTLRMKMLELGSTIAGILGSEVYGVERWDEMDGSVEFRRMCEQAPTFAEVPA